MKQYKLIIWGASGHASVVADIVRREGKYKIIGFLDNVNPESRNKEFCGSIIIGGIEQLSRLRQAGVSNIIFGFGDCKDRLRLSQFVQKKGFSLATAIHPQAVVASDAEIGEGTVIAAGAVINPGTKIGTNVIINTCASVDHDCVIKNGAHICPGVHLGGKVRIGQAAWVGIGSTVIDHVHIGEYSLIGAGSVVVSDIPPKVLAYGVPARVKKRKN
jgi:sugar O-acyltransferase (sialic acid O-acetyltransferase NeuD family)